MSSNVCLELEVIPSTPSSSPNNKSDFPQPPSFQLFRGPRGGVCSMLVILFIAFITDSAPGLLMPTMYKTILHIKWAEERWLDIMTAAYAVGRLVGALLNGYVAEFRSQSFALTLSLGAMVVGCFGYLLAYLLTRSLVHLLFSYTLIGMGSGAIAVCLSYMATVSSTDDRPMYMGSVTAPPFLAYTILPAISNAISRLLRRKNLRSLGMFQLSECTLPPLFQMVLASIGLYLVSLLLKEPPKRERSSSSGKESPLSAIKLDCFGMFACRNKAAWACLGLVFVHMLTAVAVQYGSVTMASRFHSLQDW
eukprot:CAMPEP_0184667526 /NCGR_PEP_ID=MMETSP0308-20130426/67939_1 /TAXON_ID=38269 /ORGANISM="Gloeochaete witrockiana, Strain SAG 46.84" /LENGTH=306 /DNA_ID=CAMNT_0027112779 /DNA_START=74 /DNA_END=991 /DNA_ORIENTATION=+